MRLLARVIDECLLTGTMHLPHRALLLPPPAFVVRAELGVAAAVGMGFKMLEMEQL